MNGYLLLAFYFGGLVTFYRGLINRKGRNLILIALCVLFVCVVISRQYGYKDYSDLGPYIVRYKNADNAYFSDLYGLIANCIRSLFGASATGLLFGVSFINIECLIIAAMIIIRRKYKAVSSGERAYLLCAFIFLYGLYWGVSLSSEVIRSGLAISVSLISIALLLYPLRGRDYIYAGLTYAISLFIHWTQIILLPFFIYVVFVQKVKSRSFSFYFMLEIILLFLDFINISGIIMSRFAPILRQFVGILDNEGHYGTYFEPANRPSFFGYLSLQYIYYHLLGMVFAAVRFKSNDYTKLLNGYFYGLALYTLLNGLTDAITRIQWPLLVLSCFLACYVITDKRITKSNRVLFLLFYSVTQLILGFRYLGINF